MRQRWHRAQFRRPRVQPIARHDQVGDLAVLLDTGYDGNMDLYVSRLQRNGTFAAPLEDRRAQHARAMIECPTSAADGLKMVFSSDRTDLEGEQGSFDVYVSHRRCTCAPWSLPVNLGSECQHH